MGTGTRPADTLDDIEILNQYNARSAGMYNYYRLANNATVLNSFLYVMKFSMYKTFAGSIGRACGKLFANTAATGILLYRIQRKTGQNLWCFTIRACVITTKSL